MDTQTPPSRSKTDAALVLTGDLRALRDAIDAHREGPLVIDLSHGAYQARIVSEDTSPRSTGNHETARARAVRTHRLSEREAEILGLVAQGLSNPEIGEVLYLSVNTVKTYLRTAYRKIGLRTRAQAVTWALCHGFGALQDLAAGAGRPSARGPSTGHPA
ncbi:helix-turn-helix transcriptional regulator [Nocardioides ochotonae]|uniref:helix-turn-helix transcriptional regulator n=1 Tax=Nocardioides ochotonae TaxID=2685869 RepID=UPI00140E82A6|nr:response regulator transcription factor [Nocardioides ochotonae]